MDKLLNGVDVLKKSFPDEDSFVNHVVQNILFFSKDIVEQQVSTIRQRIKDGTPIPVRYNSNSHFYHQREKNKVTPTFKNKKEALQYAKENPLFHKETAIAICFDSDGNYSPKKDIFNYTQQWVSFGKKSTIINYTIAHIWAKTDNPLYFSPLWNYCLIPAPFAFLTDKNDNSDTIVKQTKDLIKAISIELYHPQQLMQPHPVIENEIPTPTVLDKARRLIKEGKIQFVPKNNVSL